MNKHELLIKLLEMKDREYVGLHILEKIYKKYVDDEVTDYAVDLGYYRDPVNYMNLNNHKKYVFWGLNNEQNITK